MAEELTLVKLNNKIERLKAELDSIKETIEILSDKELLAGIKRGLEDLKKGRITDWEKVKSRYL